MQRGNSKDIRGRQFKGKTLIGENFQEARAGQKPIHKLIIAILGIVGACASSMIHILSGGFFSGVIYRAIEINYVFCFEVVSLYTVALILLIIRGFELAIVSYIYLAVFAVGLINIPFLSSGIVSLWTAILGLFFSITFAYLGVITTVFLVTFNFFYSGIVGEFLTISTSTLITTALLLLEPKFTSDPKPGEEILSLIPALAVIFSGIVIAQQTLKGLSKLTWIKDQVIFWAAVGGTSFYTADLKDACFDGASLRQTDFREANLTGTSFINAFGLELARTKGTILENPKVRQLLVTLNGRGQNLTGANLCGANLKRIDFREATLANVQLLDADLSDGCLTDACIQDWNINHNTRFNNVECKRVYLRRSQYGHFLDPKPDSGEFKPGEFEKWITDIQDTIDLIFQNGLNWRAFLFSLTQTAINNEGLDLSVRSIENKGDGVVVAKLNIAQEMSKSLIHQEIIDHYDHAIKMIDSKYQLILQCKDGEIERLKSFYESQQRFVQDIFTGMAETRGEVSIVGESNRIYVMNKAGDIMEKSDRNINTSGGNYNERIQGDYVQGNYYAAGQPQSLAQAAAEIQLLLKQLEQTYPTATTSQQMVVAAEAINQIENNPTMKQKVINAVKEGGLAAFEKAIDNPAGAFIAGAIKGWQEIEAEGRDQ
jgi:hypothetical protein